MQRCKNRMKAECMRTKFLNGLDILDERKRKAVRLQSLKSEALLLKCKILRDELGQDVISSIDDIMGIFRKINNEPANMNLKELTQYMKDIIDRMNMIKKSFPRLRGHCSDFGLILIELDFFDFAIPEKSLWKELCHLSNKLKYLHKREISEDDEKDFQRMSDILIKSLPNLEDPCSEIDKILYKDGTLQVDEPEKECLIDTEKLLSIIDLHDFTHAYYHMVVVKNIANQGFDNVFLKLVEIKGKNEDWFLDGIITTLLESKNLFQVCIGLKIFKAYLKVDGFAYGVEIDLCYAAFDLSHMTDFYSFVDRDENEMARFVAMLAMDCYNVTHRKDNMLIYTSRIIFQQISQRDPIGQNHIRALYEIIKSGRSSSEIFDDLCQYKLEHIIRNIVYSFLYYIRCFNKRYEELDEGMREIDKQNGQEFGGFSLEVVADDREMKKKYVLAKHIFDKYFFYDDAMKTLSLLSFLYNCVEKYENKKLQHFKLGVNFSHVTKFVVTLIHQCELNQKIDKPSWIMEKILNTCPFVVFDHDEEREKDIFLKLLNGEEIDEKELIHLKDFMVKNKLSYEDKCYE